MVSGVCYWLCCLVGFIWLMLCFCITIVELLCLGVCYDRFSVWVGFWLVFVLC